MKKFYMIILLLSLVGLTGNLNALDLRNLSAKHLENQLTKIEANLISALKSNNSGMQTSAAIVLKQIKQIVPEYEFSQTIIPLMGIVKSEQCCSTTRVTAALALHALKSERGDFAIKRTARFTEDERLKQICSYLAWDREKENTP
ncbi:MAG: hypothetical protein HZB59_13950 [Ignavibacteriales bacterium]|nr:hypothetical protein [Ignavibacteriales bacterium]